MLRRAVQEAYEGIEEWHESLSLAIHAIDDKLIELGAEYERITSAMRDLKRFRDALKVFDEAYPELSRIDNEIGLSFLTRVEERRRSE